MSDVTTFDAGGPVKKAGVFKRLVNMVPLPVWFIVPVEAILLFLLIVPSVMSIWLSLVAWQPTFGIGITDAKFVGLQNFTSLFEEPMVSAIAPVLARTVLFTLFAYLMVFVFGFLLALMMYELVSKLKGVFCRSRSVFFNRYSVCIHIRRLQIPRCSFNTPLGRPVEPEVKMT